MTLAFTRWPAALAHRYRERGYWDDLPLCDIIARHADSEATALICGERRFSYARMQQLSARLAAALRRHGVLPGQTALVQLGNTAEFYLTFFALLRAGVVPVNALYNHQRSELRAYADQIAPALLIADRRHPLFADNDFYRRTAPALPDATNQYLARS